MCVCVCVCDPSLHPTSGLRVGALCKSDWAPYRGAQVDLLTTRLQPRLPIVYCTRTLLFVTRVCTCALSSSAGCWGWLPSGGWAGLSSPSSCACTRSCGSSVGMGWCSRRCMDSPSTSATHARTHLRASTRLREGLLTQSALTLHAGCVGTYNVRTVRTRVRTHRRGRGGVCVWVGWVAVP